MKHVLALCVLFAAVPAALADEPLPGVEGGHAIVRQAPPEPEPLPAGEDGTFQVGNTRVKISGSVTVDVGVGNVRSPR